ncbi:MAG: hypothetical protein SFU57_08195 [Gemmatimonadales bacterium]|nr:hypothetical protein [Gemmatimonadales bacterium]
MTELSPSLARIARVAEALGPELAARVVFIGGAVLPLLTDRNEIFETLRLTMDVDGMVVTSTYVQKGMLEEALRIRGFRHATGTATHVDRWHTPHGDLLDLTSCGEHLGGTGSAHDRFAHDTAVRHELPPHIRHASPLGFLVLKWGAYRDRGQDAPHRSKDLSDLVVILLASEQWREELENAPCWVREFVREQATALLADWRAIGALPFQIDALGPSENGLVDRLLDRLGDVGKVG